MVAPLLFAKHLFYLWREASWPNAKRKRHASGVSALFFWLLDAVFGSFDPVPLSRARSALKESLRRPLGRRSFYLQQESRRRRVRFLHKGSLFLLF